jgi:predicted O-methyltransferase YrrM
MGQNLEITKKLETYIENLSKSLHPIQKEIISYNESLGDIKRMQIYISQCQFLELIIKASNSKKILEIGTFTGLSALSMSLALPEDGQLIALDKNADTNKVAKEFFKKAKQENKIKTIIKPALESLSDLKKENKFFDLAFIDADKDNYKEYYDQSLDLIKKGGLIIIDNVLWHGEVADEKNNEKFTNIIRNFNEHVKIDKKTDQIIMPIGDGLTVCRKL